MLTSIQKGKKGAIVSRIKNNLVHDSLIPKSRY